MKQCTITEDLWDVDGPTVFNETTPKARIEHTCIECGGKIQPGQMYENAFGVWGGDAMTFKTCSVCLEIRDKIFCDVFFYGDILNRIKREIIDEDLPICAIDGLSKEAIAVISNLITDTAEAVE